MVIDTSAIIALFLREPEALRIESALVYVPPWHCLVSSSTFLETHVAVHRKQGNQAIPELTKLLHDLQLQVIAFDATQATLACEAYRRFNRGKNGLHFGDCFAYALAKAWNEPLLCKGEDFKQTDVQLVSY